MFIPNHDLFRSKHCFIEAVNPITQKIIFS
jgi:hypothetical protein